MICLTCHGTDMRSLIATLRTWCCSRQLYTDPQCVGTLVTRHCAADSIFPLRPVMICSSTSSSWVEWLTFDASFEGCGRMRRSGRGYESTLQCPLSMKHSYAQCCTLNAKSLLEGGICFSCEGMYLLCKLLFHHIDRSELSSSQVFTIEFHRYFGIAC